MPSLATGARFSSRLWARWCEVGPPEAGLRLPEATKPLKLRRFACPEKIRTQKKPNDWGLFDVHGNVWEWVWDWYQSNYESQTGTDPTGPQTGEYRVLRGGAFDSTAQGLRSASRYWSIPDYGYRDIGLRCARGPYPSTLDTP